MDWLAEWKCIGHLVGVIITVTIHESTCQAARSLLRVAALGVRHVQKRQKHAMGQTTFTTGLDFFHFLVTINTARSRCVCKQVAVVGNKDAQGRQG